jgi:membrane protease subunit HflK
MRADYQGYRRAANVSLIGLSLQVVMTLLLFVYGFYQKDHLAMTASVYGAIGLVVWLSLAIVFDQHRRERIEAMETEALAQAGSSSVFESAQDEVRVAARRLRVMYKFFFPTVGVLIGLILIAAGVVRFGSGRKIMAGDAFQSAKDPFFVLFVTVTAGVIGFVFARFVAGMAKQNLWRNLSAGATWSVGTSLFAMAIAVGQFVDSLGPDSVLRTLHVALPIAMVVMGAEVLVNLLLEIYRPRRKGETPRLAFDSRLLGLAAAPDKVAESISEAINYQFGSNVSGTWFYRLLSKWFAGLVVMGVVVGWLLSCIVVVQPHQRGMLLRFGSVVNADVGPGVHLKMPWPVDRLIVPEFVARDARGRETRRVRTSEGVREVALGSASPLGDRPILWTNEHVLEEQFAIVLASATQRSAASEPSEEAVPDAPELNDFALVAVEVPLQYTIENVALYERLGPPEMRDKIIEAAGRRAVMRYLARRTSDELIGGDRRAIADELRAEVEAALAGLNPDDAGVPQGAGVRVQFVGASGAHPPKKAALPYERVVQAEQRREALMQAAEGDRIKTLSRSVGSVEQAAAIAAEIEVFNAMQRDPAASNVDRVVQASKIERLLVEAGGEAATVLAAARAQRWGSVMSAQASAKRYIGQVQAYRAAPRVYPAILYFEALRAVMDGARVTIIDRTIDPRIEAEVKDLDTIQNVFNPEGENP